MVRERPRETVLEQSHWPGRQLELFYVARAILRRLFEAGRLDGAGLLVWARATSSLQYLNVFDCIAAARNPRPCVRPPKRRPDFSRRQQMHAVAAQPNAAQGEQSLAI